MTRTPRLFRFCTSVFRVFPDGVFQSKEAYQLQRVFCPGSDAENSCALPRETFNFACNASRIANQRNKSVRRSLDDPQFARRLLIDCFRALGGRIEWDELDAAWNIVQYLFLLCCRENGQIDWILSRCIGGESGHAQHFFRASIPDRKNPRHGKAVLSNRSGLVRAQHIHRRRFFDGGKARHQHRVMGHFKRTQRRRYREHSGQGDRHRGHQEDECKRQDFRPGQVRKTSVYKQGSTRTASTMTRYFTMA